MIIRKRIQRLILALLLLAGGSVQVAAAAGDPAIVRDRWEIRSTDNDAAAEAFGPAEAAFLHAAQISAPAHIPGGQPTGSRVSGILPVCGLCPSGCSRRVLTLWRQRVLEHFVYQQRLSLFPEHGFW